METFGGGAIALEEELQVTSSAESVEEESRYLRHICIDKVHPFWIILAICISFPTKLSEEKFTE